jgi:hypothetical protein
MTTKIFKILHSILGIVPFLWFLAFLIIILLGTIKLGYVPQYGNIIDPYALKIGAITKAHFFFRDFCTFSLLYLVSNERHLFFY